jgi:hypothetical protein
MLSYTTTATAQYRLAIVGTLAPGTAIKYVLLGSANGGSTVAGTIDDPTANAGTVFGHAALADVTAVGAVDFPTADGLGAGAAAGDSGTGDLSGGKPDILAPVNAGTSVFAPFAGTSAAAPSAAGVAALMLQANPSLTPAQIRSDLDQTATDLGQPASVQGAGVVNALAAVDMALGRATVAACFAQGTRIATPGGLVAVEALQVGDMVLTESGVARPVIWLGHRRVECARHPRPRDVWPARVRAHAFAPGRPARDLLLSPDHAVKFGGALIPIRYLVNGATIAQLPVPTVTYWHVELPTHDILLAENLPAESFLDTGNRAAFAGGLTALHPNFARATWAARGCAPLLTDGPAVAGAHAHLLARAGALGHALGSDPGLRARWSGTGTLRLLSRTWVPADLGEPDARRLGVAVARLALDGVPLALDDPRLATGWHAAEADWRWTDGAATLLTGGARSVTFDLATPGRYWGAGKAHAMSLHGQRR